MHMLSSYIFVSVQNICVVLFDMHEYAGKYTNIRLWHAVNSGYSTWLPKKYIMY